MIIRKYAFFFFFLFSGEKEGEKKLFFSHELFPISIYSPTQHNKFMYVYSSIVFYQSTVISFFFLIRGCGGEGGGGFVIFHGKIGEFPTKRGGRFFLFS